MLYDFVTGDPEEATTLLLPTTLAPSQNSDRRGRKSSRLQEEYRSRKERNINNDSMSSRESDIGKRVAVLTMSLCLIAILSMIAFVVHLDNFNVIRHNFPDVANLLETQTTTNRVGENSTVTVNGTTQVICDWEGEGICYKRVLGFCVEHGPCIKAAPTLSPTFAPTTLAQCDPDNPPCKDHALGMCVEYFKCPEGGGDGDGGEDGDGDEGIFEHRTLFPTPAPQSLTAAPVAFPTPAPSEARPKPAGGGGTFDGERGGWLTPVPTQGPLINATNGPLINATNGTSDGTFDDQNEEEENDHRLYPEEPKVVPTGTPTPRPSTTVDCNPDDPPCKTDSKDHNGLYFCLEYYTCEDNIHYGGKRGNGNDDEVEEPHNGGMQPFGWITMFPTSMPTMMEKCESCSCWEDLCLERFLGFCTKYEGLQCPYEIGEYNGMEEEERVQEHLDHEIDQRQEGIEAANKISEADKERDHVEAEEEPTEDSGSKKNLRKQRR
jgi:hypothetical protein